MSVNIKQISKKVIASLLVIMLTITNFLLVGKETFAAIDVTEETVAETENATIETSIISKVEKAKLILQQGVIVQTSLEINVEKEDDQVLLDEKIQISVPKIDDELPQVNSILIDDVGYDAEYKNGILTINPTENKSTLKYKIVYLYTNYNSDEWTSADISKDIEWITTFSANVDGKTYNKENKETATIKKIGYETSIDISVTDKYKGLMYNTEGKVETEYNEEWKVETSYFPNKDSQKTLSLELYSEASSVIDKAGNKTNANSYYISSKIGTEMLKNIFGEEYELTITAIDADGNETLATINQPQGESTYLTVDYPGNTVNIKIQTSNMVDNSNALIIEHTKKLITDKSTDDISNMLKIEETAKLNTVIKNADGTGGIYNSGTFKGTNILEEPTAQATLTVNGNTEWSALNVNQNVELIITMLSEDMASQKLFDNPVFTIVLPEGVSVVGTPTATMSAGTLSVKNVTVENGNIVVELNGTQTSYVENGANPQISINATINVDKTLPNKTENLEMTYTNAGTETYTYNADKQVTIKSSNEALFTVMNVSVDNEQSTTYSYEEGTSEVGIDLSAASTTATINTSVINNYDVDINTTVTYKVEYTNKEGKTETLLSEATTEDVVTKASKKDYQKEITIPEDISFNENIKIEAITTYAYAGTNYSLTNTTLLKTLELEGAEDAEIIDNKLMVTTSAKKGDGTVLDANSEVFEGEVIEYTITIANITNETINDLTVVATHTNGNLYDLKGYSVRNDGQDLIEHLYEELDENEKTFENVSIEPKSTVELVYRVVVNKNNGDTTYGTIEFTTTGMEKKQVQTISNKIKDAKIKTIISSIFYEENMDIFTTSVFPIALIIKNSTTNDLKDVKVRINMNNLEWKENSTIEFRTGYELKVSDVTYNSDEEYIEFTIANLPAEYNNQEEKIIEIKPFIKAMDLSKSEEIANIYASITVDKDNYISNNIQRQFKQSKTKLTLTQTSNVEENQQLKNGDNLIIETNITNEGSIKANGVSIFDDIIPGFEVKSITINGEDKTEQFSDGMFISLINLESGETAKIIINATVNTDNMVKKQVTNIITATYMGETFTSNELTFNADVYTAEDIAKEEGITTPEDSSDPSDSEDTETPENPSEPSNPETPEAKTYSIEGNVWLDINEDGQIGEESKLNGVTVKLIDVNNKNAFVKDEDGKEISVTTDSNGKYQISDLAEGNYSVIFMYDTNKHEIANNSIAKDYMLSETKVAITSTINLTEDKTDINLGLVEIKDFDLKLDKYITKVTTQTSKETKSTTYVDKQLARTEIASKYLSGASVIVEYTIRVTNSGELAGYVTKIQDNLPKDLKFSSELNTQWYMDTDGNLYNTSLASTLINPGESKEVKLILIKNMTTENTGTTTNTAKIVTTSNAKGYQEINSDNNASQADLMINPATGKVVTYVLIVVNSIIIVLLGVYIIKRKILN